MQSRTESIRLAVVSGEFEKALRAFNGYAERLAGEIRSGTASEGQLLEMRDLVEWARCAALAARARAQARLNSIHVAGIYDPPPLRRSARVRASL